MYPLIAFSLASISETERMELESHEEMPVKEEDELKMIDLLKIPRFFFGLISQIFVFGSVTSLQPTLALHLEQFGYTAVFIGFSFAIPTMVYAATSPLIYILTSKLRKPAVILLGYALSGAGMFLVGTSKLLGIYNSPAFIILGLAILGLGCCMIIIPVLPDMIDAVEERHPRINSSILHNQISGLFIAF